MRTKVESGICYCPKCGTPRSYRNTYEVGVSFGNRGFEDTYSILICPVCNDRTRYKPPSFGTYAFCPKCTNCGQKTLREKYCIHCGAKQ